MHRRTFFRITAGAGAWLVARRATAQQGTPGSAARPVAKAPTQAALPPMTVYKSAACGCCAAWVEHARKAGFTVRIVDTEDLASVKREMGIPARLHSCHTVVMGNYLLEGHVPASDVKRLLREKPAVRGLAVPGMPVGAPGMEQGPSANYDRYEVLAFMENGATSVYARY